MSKKSNKKDAPPPPPPAKIVPDQIKSCVFLQTENDINGNSRRGWLIVFSYPSYPIFIEQGGMGSAALKPFMEDGAIGYIMVIAPVINVSVKEWNRHKKGNFEFMI